MSDRITDYTVKIRINHRCFGCLETIKKGDTAHVQVNKEDGRVYRTYLCKTCHEKTIGMKDEFFEGELRDV